MIAPALAGGLDPLIGLTGILLIELGTFISVLRNPLGLVIAEPLADFKQNAKSN